mgnify:CR=1 FL=1|tara:strand:+ start:297 stop:500 length:204 start_codon:yes stop_codon:yes gene_type:complete
MEDLSERFNEQSGGLYDYSQFGGKKNKKDKSEKYNNFKELYLKTKKELDEANEKIKELEEKLNKNKK